MSEATHKPSIAEETAVECGVTDPTRPRTMTVNTETGMITVTPHRGGTAWATTIITTAGAA